MKVRDLRSLDSQQEGNAPLFRVIHCALATAITVLVPAAATPVNAQSRTASTTLNVSTSIRENCRISTTPVAFGTVDVTASAATNAVGNFGVQCTDGTPWTVTAGVGNGSGATYTSRRMTSESNLLAYNLYTDSQRTLVFGDGTAGTMTFSGVGNGDGQGGAIWGRIPGGQASVPSGNYADVVAITVTY